jgi:putative ABC transport system ATP-binding protein
VAVAQEAVPVVVPRVAELTDLLNKKIMMANKIVEIHDLKREFQMGSEIVKALKGVSFSVEEGEFITIMGASGSGKTTMLNILGCLDKPTGGIYLLDNVDVKKLSRNELAKLRNHKIGFVFQSYNLLARTSAIENVELPLLYNPSITTTQRHQMAIHALEAVRLSDRLDHLPNQLSGGQQQRVAIARALVNKPVMILADEATGNLDSRTSYEIMSLFQELNKQGKTIVFVTHEPDIAAFSSRTITLKDGKVIKDNKNENIRSAKEMLETMPVTAE